MASRNRNSVRSDIELAISGWNLRVDNHIRRAIKRRRRYEQDIMTLGAGKVCRASAELIGSGAVCPHLRGCHTKGALDRQLREIKSPRCDCQVDGDQIVRPERKTGKSSLGSIFLPFCKSPAIAGGEIEAAVNPGTIPSSVRMQNETEVEGMSAPRNVPPNATTPWEVDQANAPACAPASTSMIGWNRPCRIRSMGRRRSSSGTSLCSHSSATCSSGKVFASNRFSSRS